ncbi:sirohydrochlorin chelatase [Prescottella sp. R16]|uniref:sirohydrochlorin chelatase n=1 Tax=Prescottella sp. R16 TaxID=3064529 RepID=UPI00272DDD41|nr:sirohydrochlorin chelatase [Prescottella sp. R16]
MVTVPPPLVAVAHGSRDPRSARVVAAAVTAMRMQRPDLDVRLAFLDLNAPSVDRVVDTVAAEGHSSAIVVPLLLGSAFHARVDLPGILAAARTRHPRLELVQADVLGGDRLLLDALRDRIADTGAAADDPETGVVLAAVGSSNADANRRVHRLTTVLGAGTRWPMSVCFATAARPSVEQAISSLRVQGARRVVIAPWFLAPGLLTDRLGAAALAADPGVVFADPIGAHPNLAAVALARYDTAVRAGSYRTRIPA